VPRRKETYDVDAGDGSVAKGIVPR
jgi:hypothetical protein